MTTRKKAAAEPKPAEGDQGEVSQPAAKSYTPAQAIAAASERAREWATPHKQEQAAADATADDKPGE